MKTEQTPKVSVIMPAYRQAEYVGDAIRSVLSQTFTDWELLIGDDGSPDNVAEEVEKVSGGDPRIRFFSFENRGLSGARNFLAGRAAGIYLLPLDADDMLHPSYIEKCLAEFNRHPDAAVVYSKWRGFGASSHVRDIAYTGYRDLLADNSIFASAMFRKSDFKRIGGYDESMTIGFEDWEFWIRMLDEDSVVLQIPEPLFMYRRKKESMSVTASRPDKEARVLRYISEKHSDKYERYYPDRLADIKELYKMRRRVAKWKRRSIFSRLWYAVTGKF
ncbi:MAG: glycosyltransferase [Muribaculaceae bacterium]|nr:glycosyltransferase [Muribaculaceae bacterium]